LIAKIKTLSSSKQALAYNDRKVNEGVARLIDSSGTIRNASEMTTEERLQELQLSQDLNDRSKQNTFHIVLSFHEDDRPKLNLDVQKEIAREYMAGIGLNNHTYFVYEHNDENHPHMHVVASIIDYSGKRLNTQNIGRKSKVLTEQLEKKHGITIADKNGIKRGKTDDQKPGPKTSKVYHINNAIESALAKKPQSFDDFKILLEEHSILVTATKNSNGKIGLRYNTLDGGLPSGTPVTAYKLSRKAAMISLDKAFNRNKAHSEKQKNRKAIITLNRIFREYNVISRSTLSQKLKEAGVSEKTNIPSEFIPRLKDFDLTRFEERRLRKELKYAFRDAKHTFGYKYDSAPVTDLRLKEYLQNVLPSKGHSIDKSSNYVIDNYIEFKVQHLETQLPRDIGSFKSEASSIIRSISKSDLDASTKAELLSEMGIKASVKDGKFHLLSKDSEFISFTPDKVGRKTLGKDTASYLLNSDTQAPKLNPREQQALRAIYLNRPLQYDSDAVTDLQLDDMGKYLDKQGRVVFREKLNQILYRDYAKGTSLKQLKSDFGELLEIKRVKTPYQTLTRFGIRGTDDSKWKVIDKSNRGAVHIPTNRTPSYAYFKSIITTLNEDGHDNVRRRRHTDDDLESDERKQKR